MTLDTQTVIAIGVPALAGIIWAIRLEGRINLNERVTNDLAEDVKYIRNRIDAALRNRRT